MDQRRYGRQLLETRQQEVRTVVYPPGMKADRSVQGAATIRTAILGVRDSLGMGGDLDGAVAAVREVLAKGPFTEVDYQVIPDEQAMVRSRLRLWADDGAADLVLTLGGVGAALRHRVPDATLETIDRQFPGIPERLRWASAKVDPNSGLWRCATGLRRRTLIVNLPDEPASISASLPTVSRLLIAAVRAVGQSLEGLEGAEGLESPPQL